MHYHCHLKTEASSNKDNHKCESSSNPASSDWVSQVNTLICHEYLILLQAYSIF